MATIYSMKGEKTGTIKLGKVFSFPLREGLIKRAVIASQANRRQKYGADKLAGLRTSAHYHGSSQVYPHARMAGRGMARLPRIHGQGPLLFIAREASQTVKGRKSHAPVAERNFTKTMNKKEKKLALYSALSASVNKELVLKRGHKIEKIKEVPLIVDDELMKLKKTKEMVSVLNSLGLKEELKRGKEKIIRAGKGTTRGRKYKRKKSALIIISEKCDLQKTARNIPGIEISIVKELNVEKLAPGNHPGRLTVFTKSAVEQLNKLEL
ncbi:MAG: 50S ribosomal protein L4 [Candidatus Aenigmarchaeota archaeon]|nr:50S ribosomal protein L4 [Candidatus Aenigmarchaeota archaeon]